MLSRWITSYSNGNIDATLQVHINDMKEAALAFSIERLEAHLAEPLPADDRASLPHYLPYLILLHTQQKLNTLSDDEIIAALADIFDKETSSVSLNGEQNITVAHTSFNAPYQQKITQGLNQWLTQEPAIAQTALQFITTLYVEPSPDRRILTCTYPDRLGLVEMLLPVDHPDVLLWEACRHEALHALIHHWEIVHGPLWMGDEAIRLTSPWSGRDLTGSSITHACFVWYVIAKDSYRRGEFKRFNNLAKPFIDKIPSTWFSKNRDYINPAAKELFTLIDQIEAELLTLSQTRTVTDKGGIALPDTTQTRPGFEAV